MNKQEYFEDLRKELQLRKVKDIEMIISDYQEHFMAAKQSGKTDDEVIKKLGAPEQIAKAYEAEALIQKVENSQNSLDFFSILGRLMILAPLNFFIVIGPVIVSLSLLIAAWSVSGAMSIVSLIGMFGGIFISPLAALGVWVGVGVFFLGLGFFSLAIISSILLFKLTKLLFQVLVSYLKWNVNFVINKEGAV